MVGKNCFAIASDSRLGVQLQTIATDFQRIFKIHEKLFIGLSGLATDVQTLYQRLVFRHKLYQLQEATDMKPKTFASLVYANLYEKSFQRTSQSFCFIMMGEQLNGISLSGQRGQFKLVMRSKQNGGTPKDSSILILLRHIYLG